jgi:hypothetical protein
LTGVCVVFHGNFRGVCVGYILARGSTINLGP